MKEENNSQMRIKEARALLTAAWSTINEERYEQLILWAREIIEPLVEANYPPALWLKCALPYAADLSEEDVDRLHREALEKAAQAGDAEAQFSLACDLDESRLRPATLLGT